jgi:hypothetical protein
VSSNQSKASETPRRVKCQARIVRDHGGQQLAYVYFEDEPGRRSAAKLLTKNEARRIAANIVNLSFYLTIERLKWDEVRGIAV